MNAAVTQDFKQLQHKFANWLRTAEAGDDFPAIEARRLAVYRRLVHNNIRQFLDNGFPVLRKVLSDREWRALVEGFIAQHRAASPLFSDIGQEFVDYLAQLDLATTGVPVWTFELAHYERLEVDVQFANPPDVLAAQTLEEATLLRLEPSARIACYQYAVAEISAEHLPTDPEPQPYCVVVYQTAQGQVRFLQLNPMTAFVLELLQQQPTSLVQLCDTLMAQLPGYTADQLKTALTQLLEDFAARGVLSTTA
nr:PqqD family peptide modification chaperone [Pseudidiomarina sediminum]